MIYIGMWKKKRVDRLLLASDTSPNWLLGIAQWAFWKAISEAVCRCGIRLQKVPPWSALCLVDVWFAVGDVELFEAERSNNDCRCFGGLDHCGQD